MNLARQAVIEQQPEIHAALWPSLSTMAGFDTVANIQIEAMMRNHALTGGCFVISASSPVTPEMLQFLEDTLGPQEFLCAGGGWSAVIHPFSGDVVPPVSGEQEQLVIAEIDLADIQAAKLWLDGTGHYARPEILKLVVDRQSKPTVEYLD